MCGRVCERQRGRGRGREHGRERERGCKRERERGCKRERERGSPAHSPAHPCSAGAAFLCRIQHPRQYSTPHSPSIAAFAAPNPYHGSQYADPAHQLHAPTPKPLCRYLTSENLSEREDPLSATSRSRHVFITSTRDDRHWICSHSGASRALVLPGVIPRSKGALWEQRLGEGACSWWWMRAGQEGSVAIAKGAKPLDWGCYVYPCAHAHARTHAHAHAHACRLCSRFCRAHALTCAHAQTRARPCRPSHVWAVSAQMPRCTSARRFVLARGRFRHCQRSRPWGHRPSDRERAWCRGRLHHTGLARDPGS